MAENTISLQAGGATDETSPLMVALQGDNGNYNGSSDASPAPSEDSVQSTQLWEELEKPWPSTYERSIALLSSPVLQKTQIDLYTKSPKPGSTPAALSRRRDLRRGYYTPEGGRFFPPRKMSIDAHSDREQGFRKEIEKVKSLDFAAKKGQFQQFQKEQERKALEAKKYRAKILKQKDEEDALMSPGHAREKKRDRQKLIEQAEAMLHDGKATMMQCIFNLANILMGVGLLALPFAMKSAGWLGGIFCICVFGLITWRTSILIGRELNGDPRPAHVFVDSPFKSPLQPGSVPEARMYPPISSFPDIARASFGESGCLALSVVLYFELFSCICIFFVTMGDHLHELFPAVSATTHVLIVGTISIIPAVVLRTPTLLSYLSMVGTFATIAVVLSVVASAFAEGDMSESVAKNFELGDGPYHILWDSSGIAMAFGLVAYCFSGHAIVPSIYTSMKKPQDFEKMVTVTFAVVLVACLCVGASGYYMFGSTVLDQITLSLQRSSHAGSAMKALTWLMVLTGKQFFRSVRFDEIAHHVTDKCTCSTLVSAFSKTTLTMFPLALGMEEILAPYLTSERMVAFTSTLIKLVLTGLAMFIGIYVPSFSFLCALVGMICTMSVSVIFPAAAHLNMFYSKLSLLDKVLDISFVVIGTVMAVVGTIVTVA